MTIPAHKMKALVKESKKKRPFGSSADNEDDDKKDDEDDEDEDEHAEPDGDEGKNPKKPSDGDGDAEDDEDDDGEGGGDGGPQKKMADMVSEAADRVDSGDTDDEVMGHLDGYDAEEDDNSPPDFITDEGKWAKAKKAIEPKWDDYDDPYAVVGHVYKAMGGKFK